MEAEVVSACNGTKDAAWLRKFWQEIEPNLQLPVNVGLDNEAAIYFGNADVDHTRAKHIDLRFYYIKAAVSDEIIRLWYCPGLYNPADIFTKSLKPDHHVYLMRMLGMRRIEEVCY